MARAERVVFFEWYASLWNMHREFSKIRCTFLGPYNMDNIYIYMYLYLGVLFWEATILSSCAADHLVATHDRFDSFL